MNQDTMYKPDFVNIRRASTNSVLSTFSNEDAMEDDDHYPTTTRFTRPSEDNSGEDPNSAASVGMDVDISNMQLNSIVNGRTFSRDGLSVNPVRDAQLQDTSPYSDHSGIDLQSAGPDRGSAGSHDSASRYARRAKVSPTRKYDDVSPSPTTSSYYGGVSTWPVVGVPQKNVRESLRSGSKKRRVSPQVSPDVHPNSVAYPMHALNNHLPYQHVEMPNKYKRRGMVRRSSVSSEAGVDVNAPLSLDNKLESQPLPASISASSIGSNGSMFAVPSPPGMKPKGVETLKRIAASVSQTFIFRDLSDEQRASVFNAMREVPVKRGDVIINQGQAGSNFYVIERGRFEAYVQNDHRTEKVANYNNQGSFGELALMYNCPRSATVQAISDGTLWALDRETFRHIVITSGIMRHQANARLLQTFPIFCTFTDEQRADIGEQLKPLEFKQGEAIIQEGSPADGFYLVVEGDISVSQRLGMGTIEIARLHRGQYFGELAILRNAARSASCLALTPVVKCLRMSIDTFRNVFQDLEPAFRKHAERYRNVQ